MTTYPAVPPASTTASSTSVGRMSGLHESARRYSLTRASGSPVDSRSEMTATDAAPAPHHLGRPLECNPADRHDRRRAIGMLEECRRPRSRMSCRRRDIPCPSSTCRRSAPRQYSRRPSSTPRAPDRPSASTLRRSRRRREFCGPTRDRDRPVPRARRRPPTASRCRRDRSRSRSRPPCARAPRHPRTCREMRRSPRAYFEFE